MSTFDQLQKCYGQELDGRTCHFHTPDYYKYRRNSFNQLERIIPRGAAYRRICKLQSHTTYYAHVLNKINKPRNPRK